MKRETFVKLVTEAAQQYEPLLEAAPNPGAIAVKIWQVEGKPPYVTVTVDAHQPKR